MKKTIYIYDHGAVINRNGTHLQIRLHDELIFEEPVVNVDSIVMFEFAQITTQALCTALENDIPVVYTSKSSKIIGVTYPRFTHRPHLRLAQYAVTIEPRDTLMLAKTIISAKIQGQMSTLQAYRCSERNKLKAIFKTASAAKDISQLMGFEGAAAALYFRVFGTCLKNMEFTRRQTHPAYDPINAVLNLSYSLALNKIDTILSARGFDTSIGILHSAATNRAALSLDLLEAFRGTLDRFVLKLINRREVNEDDFRTDENGCVLSKKGFQKYISAYSREINIAPLAEKLAERLKNALICKEVEKFEISDMYSLL